MLTWNVVYWSVLHLILDSTWVWYSLLLELKIPALASTLRFLIVSLTLRSLFSPSDENIQLETLGEEFDLAGMSDGEDTPYFEFWTLRCIGIVRTMARFAHLICLRVCVMRCFGIVRTIPTSSSSWSTDHTFDLGLCLLLLRRTTTFFDDFDHRLRTTFRTLVYIVDWLLQWSKDYSDTTVFGWPTLWMSNRTFYSTLKVWSCEILSLCGKLIWRWNVVFWLLFCIQKKVVQIPCMNHFVLEKLTCISVQR